MEKRILFAFLLSMAVLWTFRAFYAPDPTNTARSSPPVVAVPDSAPADQGRPVESSQTDVQTENREIVAASAEDAVVDTDLYTATFTNVGGVLKSFKLKGYTDALGNPIELIDAMGASRVGFPLAIQTLDAPLNELLSSSRFLLNRDGLTLSMELATNGVHARKAIQFDANDYDFTIESTLSKAGSAVPHSIVWQGGFGDQSIPYEPTKNHVVYPTAGSFKRLTVSGIKEPQQMTVARIGVEDQYFLSMFLVESPATVTIRKHEYTNEAGKTIGTLAVAVPVNDTKPIRTYVGPKNQQWLAKADTQLAGVIDYGFFEIITRPLMVALLWIHSFVGNFGWSIILLTLFINFVLFPLRLKQQMSMQKMQRIQPQMRTLQDKYKKLKANDPRRVEIQAQMMNLYKEHGVNPMSGCLPLLLQMPFLYAFYNMLSVSIELRQAPWILWIRDLSQHDPTYIMPILMAVSMIVTQKMTPTTVDPAQAKIMMIMPLMLTAMFLWVQSGLMLYWLTSNVVGIGQQIFINKYWAPQAAHKSKSGKNLQRTE
jgi:YidC/Oxa1 family membrane protein insertase